MLRSCYQRTLSWKLPQLQRTLTKSYSSLTFENEQLEFANRKSQIKSNHKSYYPTLNQIRSDVKPIRIPEFRTKFTNYQWPESKRIDELHAIEGKISSIRKSGKGMLFIDVLQDFTKVQLVVMNRLCGLSKDEFYQHHEFFKKGDYINAIGFPGITNVGELSLKCTKPLFLAAPTLHPLPPKLNQSEKRHHNRVVDYLINSRSQQIIITRSLIIQSIRTFLTNRGFLEVTTPIISNSSKGANATPFITHSKHLKSSNDKLIDLQLRVAPELWLKKLIIGGFDKVFEIGSSFRNEGIDGTHNPEFTTLEFYQSFTTLEELMNLTEELFLNIFKSISHLNITRPQLEQMELKFKKIEFIPTIELETGVQFPSKITKESLLVYFNEIQLPLPKVQSIPQLLDKLSSTYLEPLCDTPTFIYHQPSIMAPLAKSIDLEYNGHTYDVSKRFEMFIRGKEFVNAYEEENSPFDQEIKFKLQQQLKDEYHDEDSIVPDDRYLKVMEWGMPPTGGFGLGIDRLCMLLVGERRIEEVLTFGTLSDVTKQ